MGTRLTVFGAILAIATAAAAQQAVSGVPRGAANQQAFFAIGTRDGLSNGSVSSIVQDEAGFMWFGTQGGLNRYDGTEFKVFANEPFVPDSLSHDLVQTLYLDGSTLWVGTYGGLNRLDLLTERLVSFRSMPDDPTSLSNDVVVCVARDGKGSLWVGTLGGLNRLDEKTGTFTRFLHDKDDPASLPADLVRDLQVDRSGRLWVATSGGGLALFDYATEGFRAFRHDPRDPASLPSDFAMCIDEDPEGALWIGTWSGGLSRLDPDSLAFRNLVLEDSRVYAVNAREPGTVWIGTWGGGLFEHDAATGRTVRYRASGLSGALSHDTVYSILRDRSGELWVGTNGGGVNKLTRSRRSFLSYVSDPKDPGSLAFGKTNALHVDGAGVLWAGIYNGGLNRLDPVTGAWRRWVHDPKDPRSLPNDIVTSISDAGEGRLWVTTNGGFARFDPATGRFEVMSLSRPGAAPAVDEVVYKVLDDREGGLWVATYTSGLLRWRADRGVTERHSHDPADPSSLSDNLVFDLLYDASGRLWIATNKGLNRLEGGRFVRYLYDPANRSGVSGNAMRGLFLDSRGELWIASNGGGLMRYERGSDSFVHYTKADGLPNNAALKTLEDASGNLWVSTQGGLALIERGSGLIRSLSIYNELRDRELHNGAAIGPDGSLYFGSLGAIFRFDPGRYEYNDRRPAVVLTSVEAGGRAKPLGTVPAALGELRLPWDGNAVTFRFAALDYRDPERNRYAYRLEGFDKDWIAADARKPSASYTNLPGGRYLFRVKASNSDGLWNEEGIRLPVTVAVAPWLSPWAYLLYAVAIGAAAWLVSSARSSRLLAKAVAELASARETLARNAAEIERLGSIDRSTGLPDAGAFLATLSRTFDEAERERGPVAVIALAIEGFRRLEDARGLGAAEELAVSLAAALREAAGTVPVARIRPGEFALVLRAEVDEARNLEARLLAAARATGGPTLVSGIAASRPVLGDDPGELLVAARASARDAGGERLG